jgi:CHC2 zinc finger
MKTEPDDIEFDKGTAYKVHLQSKKKYEKFTDDDLLFAYYQLPVFAEQWRESMPKFKEDELLKIFPEAKEIIPEKIAEWEEATKELYETIKSELIKIKLNYKDSCTQQIHREFLKLTLGKELLKIDSHVARLKRILTISENKPQPKGWINEMDVQKALLVPIESLISMNLRKSGRSSIGLCPLHNEKTPSFHVYTDQNQFWCYGCNQGGNSIKFVMLLYGFTFIKAVKFLIK